jgi:uncharacterized protein (TIGR00661 family)
MARIVYGVMGDARGHLARSLVIAREMPQHEFLFVGGGAVQEARSLGYQVESVPMASTFYRNNKVDFPATIANALRALAASRPTINRVADIIKGFDPDLVVSDYELFTPLAALKLSRPCVSLDHQHVITHCAYQPPRGHRLSRVMTSFAIRKLYSHASVFLITSFFAPPPRDPRTTWLFPPVIGSDVTKLIPSNGEHVLVYQTSPTFHRLFPVLQEIPGRFVIYGLGKKPEKRNLQFKPTSRNAFLDDLASCRYAITNGGHNVISEALYLGKPLLSFPIKNAYEQLLNAHFVKCLGYGDYSLDSLPVAREIRDFESRLDELRRTIQTTTFFGNHEVAQKLESFIQDKSG